MRKKVRQRRARYAVGYGRPPTSSQFQPGLSGNPNGRPKGARNASSMARDALDRAINVKVKGIWRKMTVRKAAYLRLAERAVAGDAKAFDYLLSLESEQHPSGPDHSVNQPLSAKDLELLQFSSIVGGPACRNKCSLMHASSNVLIRKTTTDEKTNSVREAADKIPTAPSKWVNNRPCSERPAFVLGHDPTNASSLSHMVWSLPLSSRMTRTF
jgi:hypothetical protein